MQCFNLSCVQSLITNEWGGIKDDTVINNAGNHLYVVCNAGCADKDLEHFKVGRLIPVFLLTCACFMSVCYWDKGGHSSAVLLRRPLFCTC